MQPALDENGEPIPGHFVDRGGFVFKIGAPPIALDADEITRLAQEGCSIQVIADYFKVHVGIIWERYGDAYHKGRAFLKHQLAKCQLDRALAGDTTMLKWLGKHYLNQDDTIKLEHAIQNPAMELSIDDLKAEYARIKDDE